ncbi:unnamed protein product [Anisakis simplex]|uniref:Fucosyltransferase n=1 Tax=Anisakis simplex TaxID=6269 RepID=A0A0M3JW89_ANISI|nr:unnamed protein product [Anisakis simplex]
MWYGIFRVELRNDFQRVKNRLVSLQPHQQLLLQQEHQSDVISANYYRTDRVLEQLALKPSKLASQPVLIYHHIEDTSINAISGFAEFERNQCLVKNCFLTTFERHQAKAHVVLLSARSSMSSDYHKPHGQVWILQLFESPENTDSLKMFNAKINYTASYRWDSDIVTPYLRWWPSSTLKLPMNNDHNANHARGKTKKVACNNVIPIVMGPPKQFYQRIAPPNSFIHVNDFDGPENLARYLHEIDRNDTMYNSFFEWHRSGAIMDSKFWCRLCAIVQQPPFKYYNDIDSWWHNHSDCASST